MSRYLQVFETYKMAVEAFEAAHKISSQKNAEMRKVESQLIEAMVDEGVRSFGLEDSGVKVYLNENFSIACNKDNEYLVREWLTENEGDVELFTKRALDKSAITALIRKKVEEGEMERHAVPEFFKLNERPVLNVRGWDARQPQPKEG